MLVNVRTQLETHKIENSFGSTAAVIVCSQGIGGYETVASVATAKARFARAKISDRAEFQSTQSVATVSYLHNLDGRPGQVEGGEGR